MAIVVLDLFYRHTDNREMDTKTAIEFYGNQTLLGEALGVAQPTVAGWLGKDQEGYPPEIQQVKLERITRGKLRAEPSCYKPKERVA